MSILLTVAGVLYLMLATMVYVLMDLVDKFKYVWLEHGVKILIAVLSPLFVIVFLYQTIKNRNKP